MIELLMICAVDDHVVDGCEGRIDCDVFDVPDTLVTVLVDK
jgi:hypothetical protein